ncbi:MAG: VWA domain-containing protein [Desulfobacterales bacterium]
MIENFHFLRSYWLLILIPTTLVWWTLFRRQNDKSAWKGLIAPHLLDHLLVGSNRKAQIQPIHLLLVVWVLMGVSRSGPSWRKEPSPFSEDTAGMFVLLKVTPSMMAEDVPPSRLERAKQKLHDLLDLRQWGATGLIAYSGSAHLVMPLTRDGRIVNTMAEGLGPDTMPVEGDALVDAISLAGKLFNQPGRIGSVVVITDTVSPAQIAKFDQKDSQVQIPLQFLALNPLGAPADKGLAEAANALDAQVSLLSVDASDVRGISRQAEQDLKSVLAEQSGERWKDSGYAFVPLIVLVSLMWARRGWTVQEEGSWCRVQRFRDLSIEFSAQ